MAIKTSTLGEARSAAMRLLDASDQVAEAKRVVTALALTFTDADAQALDPQLDAAKVGAALTVLADFDTWLNTSGRLAALLTFRG